MEEGGGRFKKIDGATGRKSFFEMKRRREKMRAMIAGRVQGAFIGVCRGGLQFSLQTTSVCESSRYQLGNKASELKYRRSLTCPFVMKRAH